MLTTRRRAPGHRLLTDIQGVGSPTAIVDRDVDQGTAHRSASAAQLCDRHAAALFSLAVAVIGDRHHAESAVVAVIAGAYPVPASAHTDLGIRQELARRIYRYCSDPGALAQQPDHPGADHSARRGLSGSTASSRTVSVADLADLRRTTMAMVHFGRLTYRDVATLLDLEADTVLDLLTSGLRDLAARE